MFFGTISFLWLILDYLALTDIWHGETNLDLEWKIVAIGFIVHLIFYLSIAVTLLSTRLTF